jgi:hypothetical protein
VLLRPSLDELQTSLASLKLDKWKKGTVREEAEANVASIQHDLDTNLPPLLSASDTSPGAVSTAIPLLKHLDAVYDVLLRVEEAARVSAPGDQIDTLQKALLKLSSARLALDDQLQTVAATQEKQVVELQTAIKTQQAAQAAHVAQAAAAPPAPCKVTPAHKKKPATTPAKKTTPPAPATGPASGSATAPSGQKTP